MREPIKVHGRFVSADETAKVLGVPKDRAEQLILMLRDSAKAWPMRSARSGCFVKTETSGKSSLSWGAKKRAAKSATGRRNGGSKPIVKYASKKASITKKSATKTASK